MTIVHRELRGPFCQEAFAICIRDKAVPGAWSIVWYTGGVDKKLIMSKKTTVFKFVKGTVAEVSVHDGGHDSIIEFSCREMPLTPVGKGKGKTARSVGDKSRGLICGLIGCSPPSMPCPPGFLPRCNNGQLECYDPNRELKCD